MLRHNFYSSQLCSGKYCNYWTEQSIFKVNCACCSTPLKISMCTRTVIIQQRIKMMETKTSIEQSKWGEFDQARVEYSTIATQSFKRNYVRIRKIIRQGAKKRLGARRTRRRVNLYIWNGEKGMKTLVAQISFPKGAANKFNNPVQRDFNYKISPCFIHVTQTRLYQRTHTGARRLHNEKLPSGAPAFINGSSRHHYGPWFLLAIKVQQRLLSREISAERWMPILRLNEHSIEASLVPGLGFLRQKAPRVKLCFSYRPRSCRVGFMNGCCDFLTASAKINIFALCCWLINDLDELKRFN